MWMNIEQPDSLLKLCVWGEPGTGKTWLGCSAPKPVILLTERHGFETVRAWARDAGQPMPPVFWIQSTRDLKQALDALASSSNPIADIAKHHGATAKQIAALPYDKPKTVVLDSLTEMADMVIREMEASNPPQIGKDGYPVRSQRFWPVMEAKVLGITRAFRDLPMHSLFLCLQMNKTVGDEGNQRRIMGPSMPMNKMPGAIASMCNAVGMMQVANDSADDETGQMQFVRQVRFLLPDYATSKVCRPLLDVESPDVSEWIAKHDSYMNEDVQ